MIPFLNQKKADFEKILGHLKSELAGIRGGRAHAALLDKIVVDAYGSKTSLKGLAGISTPDAKTLQIEAWDQNLIDAIVKALNESDLGLVPNAQGKIIRLSMPPMTEERRAQFLKLVKEKTEAARVGLRQIREKVREQIIKMEKEKQIGEDDRFRAQEDLDKMTKEFVEKAEKTASEKEKEIMTV